MGKFKRAPEIVQISLVLDQNEIVETNIAMHNAHGMEIFQFVKYFEKMFVPECSVLTQLFNNGWRKIIWYLCWTFQL